MADLTYDGTILAYWITDAAYTPTAPQVAKITAGVPLHLQMTPNGLTYGPGQDTIDNSTINSTFTTNVVGRRTFAPTVTIKRDSADVNGIEAALTFKANGWLAVRKNLPAATAPATGQKWDSFPGQVGNAQPNDPAPNTLQTITYALTMTGDAALGATAV